MKKALSVTLDRDNVLWLKSRAGAAGAGSVSQLLDRIVTQARGSGHLVVARSVVGTIDIDAADPGLATADADVHALFDRSLGRPVLLRERPPTYRTRRRG